MIKKYVFLFIAITLSTTLYAEDKIKINDIDVYEGQTVNLYKNELKNKKVEISVESDRDYESLEISLDRGRNWNAMKQNDNIFMYSFRPSKSDKYDLSLHSLSVDGPEIKNLNIRIVYSKEDPQTSILKILDKMKMFYENERSRQFLGLFSNRYPNLLYFTEAIEADSYNYKNIRLRYRIDRKVISPDKSSAILDVYWERKYDDRSTDRNSDSALITLYFIKEGKQWKISGMNNNTLFGSALPSTSSSGVAAASQKADLLALAGSFVKVSGWNTRLTVKNDGQAASGLFKIAFYFKSGASWLLDGTETVNSLAAGAQLSVNHTYTSPTAGPYDLKAVIDSSSQVSELNESNNEITTNVVF